MPSADLPASVPHVDGERIPEGSEVDGVLGREAGPHAHASRDLLARAQYRLHAKGLSGARQPEIDVDGMSWNQEGSGVTGGDERKPARRYVVSERLEAFSRRGHDGQVDGSFRGRLHAPIPPLVEDLLE